MESYQPLVTSGEHAVKVERVSNLLPRDKEDVREALRAGAGVVYWDPE